MKRSCMANMDRLSICSSCVNYVLNSQSFIKKNPSGFFVKLYARKPSFHKDFRTFWLNILAGKWKVPITFSVLLSFVSEWVAYMDLCNQSCLSGRPLSVRLFVCLVWQTL